MGRLHFIGLSAFAVVLTLIPVDATAQDEVVTPFRQRVYDAIRDGLNYLSRQQDAGTLGWPGRPTMAHGLVISAFLDQPRP